MVLDDFDETLGSGDPDRIQRRLDDLDVKLERMARSYEELDRATESLRITETDSSDAVRVTVDSQGRLIELVTTHRVAQLRPEKIGPLVLACVRRAQSAIADRIAALAGKTVGEDEMAAHVVATMRARFPGPAPTEPAAPARSTGSPYLTIGDIEEDTEPPAPYPTRDSRGGRRA
jgi:hypothetical protein